MGLRRQAITIPEEPRPSFGTRPVVITASGKIASGGPTVQPGTKFEPFINRTIDRRDVGISVGTKVFRGVPRIHKMPGIPTLRKPIAKPVVQVPAKVARTASPSNQGLILTPLPPGWENTGVRGKNLPKLDPRILNPPSLPDNTTFQNRGPLDVLIDLIKPKEVTPVGLDLGNLLSVGINAYRDVRVAQSQPVYDFQGLNPFSEVPLNQYDMAAPDGSVALGTCLPPGYKYDKCGRVVKTRRRRRRRLATSSDIKDLAALSSVTTGQEKKTWIATHPS